MTPVIPKSSEPRSCDDKVSVGDTLEKTFSNSKIDIRQQDSKASAKQNILRECEQTDPVESTNQAHSAA